MAERDNRRFAAVLALVHLAVVGASLRVHAMWRDEIEAWLLATTASFHTLYHDLAYTGHPSLWYLVLRAVHLSGAGMWAMQLVCALYASLAVYLFARCAPFSRLQKTLFAFGYFSVFEYAVISRDYGLSFLLMTVLCVVATARRPRPVLLAVITGLICHTNTHGMIVSVPFALLAIMDSLRAVSAERGRATAWRLGVASAAVLLVSAASAAWLVQAPPDSPFAIATGNDLYWHLRLLTHLQAANLAFQFLASGYAPIPAITTEFFNTNILAMSSGLIVAGSLAVALVLALTLRALPRKHAAVLAGTTVALLVFFIVVYPGGTRHHGFLFTAFWMTVWAAFSKATPGTRRILSGALTGVLAVQVLAGVVATTLHARAPFSQGKQVAEFLERNNLAAMPIAADFDVSGVTVAGYLGRTIYFPRAGFEGYYVRFDQRRNQPMTAEQALLAIANHFPVGARVVLVFSYDLPPELKTAYGIEPLAAFDGAVIGSENFWVSGMKIPAPAQGPRP